MPRVQRSSARVHESAGTRAVSIKHCRSTGQMSDFFASISGGGFKFPNTERNGGPLPGAPSGANATPDGQFNFNSALLEGITPFAGPKGGNPGSDRSYQQVSLSLSFPYSLSLDVTLSLCLTFSVSCCNSLSVSLAVCLLAIPRCRIVYRRSCTRSGCHRQIRIQNQGFRSRMSWTRAISRVC